jgi:hypothetical protein
VAGTGTATVTLTGTPAQITTTLQATNGVVYHGNASFTGTDTLTVTTNDNGQTGTGAHPDVVSTEKLGVIPKVWFIDNTAGSGGDGSQADPFDSIAAFNAASTGHSTNEYVYLKTGTGTYSEADGINLKNGQTLVGQGDGLTFTDPLHPLVTLTIEIAGTAPTIVATAGDGIDLAQNNTITGLHLGNASGSAIADTGGVGNLTISNVDINTTGQAVKIANGGTLTVDLSSVSTSGGTNGVALTNTTGTFHIHSGGTISNASGADIALNGGTVAFTDDGAISDATGTVVSITNMTGGTNSFTGAIGTSVNPDGAITLTNNTGATIGFSGGMTLSTGTSNAFTATGGGTVTVTGTNHLTTTTGTALNISNTTIGSGNVTFQDISSNGAVNGIVLNNTGTSGHLAVTGNGSTVTDGSNSSGGTIQNTTADGISLTSTTGATFTNMLIKNTTGDGITGTSVHGFTFANGKIDNSGTGHATNASNIGFDNISSGINNIDGAVSVTGSVLTNAYYHGIDIYNESGTISNLTVSSNTLTATGVTATSKGSGVHVDVNGSASTGAQVTQATISGNTIDKFVNGAGIQIQGGNAALGPAVVLGVVGSSTNIINITNNAIGVNSAGAPMGTNAIAAAVTGTGQGHFSIANNGTAANPIQHFLGIGISASGGNFANVNYVINNNFIDGTDSIAGSNAMAVGSQLGVGQNGTISASITSNTINHASGHGIFAGVTNSGNTANLIIKNNTVGASQSLGTSGISVVSGTSSGSTTLNLDMTGNTTQGSDDPGGSGLAPGITFRLQNNANDHFNIVGLGNGSSAATAEDFLSAQNPSSNVGDANYSATARAVKAAETGTNSPALIFNSAAPFTVNLNAAPGGVQASSPTAGEAHLTQAELNSVVAAAIAQWAHAGASAAQLAALLGITFSVADLSGNTLGQESSGHITIDADAAGHGWFIDPTPSDNSEFTHAASAAGTDLFTDPTNAAAGHIDLLTAVMHEMGHELGLADLTAPGDIHNLMYISLVDGERRVPDGADVTLAKASGTTLPPSAQNLAGAPIVVGTAGNDAIDAGYGGKILFGGAGADSFVFGPNIHLGTPAAPAAQPITHVADYSAAQGDSFDFSALTSAFHAWNVTDASLVRVVEDHSGTFATLQLNTTPGQVSIMPTLQVAPTWVNVAQIDGAHAGDAVNVLVDSHAAIHLAHLHVDLLV